MSGRALDMKTSGPWSHMLGTPMHEVALACRHGASLQEVVQSRDVFLIVLEKSLHRWFRLGARARI